MNDPGEPREEEKTLDERDRGCDGDGAGVARDEHGAGGDDQRKESEAGEPACSAQSERERLQRGVERDKERADAEPAKEGGGVEPVGSEDDPGGFERKGDTTGGEGEREVEDQVGRPEELDTELVRLGRRA